MSRRIGTRTSGCVAFSWITAGSWSSKLRRSKTEGQSLHDDVQHLTVFFKRAQRFPVLSSPQWEGPLLVAAQPAAVDGGRARHSVQVMRAVGQRWNPLTVPLCLLFPTNNHRHTDVKTFEIAVLSTSNYLFRDLAQRTEFVSPEPTVVGVPEVGGGLGADGDSFVLFIISLKDLLDLRGLQQGHTSSKLSVAMI